MNKQALRADALFLLTACIWGFGFVAQSRGMDYVGPYTYNGVRFLLGSASLVPLTVLRLRRPVRRLDGKTGKPLNPLTAACFFALAGACLFAASALQQLGILYTTVGNSGFITGLSVVLTPVMGSFLGKKTGIPTWAGAALTLAGLFFISAASQVFGASGPVRINRGDVLTAISAFFFAAHILLIDNLVRRIDPVLLSAGQFFFCGLFSLAIALVRETVAPGALLAGIVPILYGGVCSVGIAYTLQAAAQRYAPPAHATILLSLEGTFAALGGVLLLAERLGGWTLAGFAFMLSGMLATQWDVIRPGRRPAVSPSRRGP